ncbi:MAG: DUF4412 domain-containing protein [Verrucomicrobiota bacterium]
MNKIFLSSLFAFLAGSVQADLVILQKVESQNVTGDSVTKCKGDKVRIDMPVQGGGSVSVLMDMKSGETVTLLHSQRKAMKATLDESRKVSELQHKLAFPKSELPKATGRKEKIGDWNCEVYEGDFGGMRGKLWVTKDSFSKGIIEQMNHMNTIISLGRGWDPSKVVLDGLTVKTEMATPAGKMTTLIVKISEEVVADSEFVIPAAYNLINKP